MNQKSACYRLPLVTRILVSGWLPVNAMVNAMVIPEYFSDQNNFSFVRSSNQKFYSRLIIKLKGVIFDPLYYKLFVIIKFNRNYVGFQKKF